MPKPPPLPYRAHDLMEAGGGISYRTLSRWFQAGIFGPPPRRGPGVRYSDEHMLRARAALAIRADVPDLESIRRTLDGATRTQLESWVAQGGLPPPQAPSILAPEAPTYPATRHDHVDLAPGLSLIVRADCDPAVRALAQEIYARFGPGRR